MARFAQIVVLMILAVSVWGQMSGTLDNDSLAPTPGAGICLADISPESLRCEAKAYLERDRLYRSIVGAPVIDPVWSFGTGTLNLGKYAPKKEVQAQTYTGYNVHSFSYDHDKRIASWTLSTRITNEAGDTLKTIEKEAKYTLNLETGEVANLKTTGFIDINLHAEVWQEVLHVRALLVHVSDILSESAEDDLRASK